MRIFVLLNCTLFSAARNFEQLNCTFLFANCTFFSLDCTFEYFIVSCQKLCTCELYLTLSCQKLCVVLMFKPIRKQMESSCTYVQTTPTSNNSLAPTTRLTGFTLSRFPLMFRQLFKRGYYCHQPVSDGLPPLITQR